MLAALLTWRAETVEGEERDRDRDRETERVGERRREGRHQFVKQLLNCVVRMRMKRRGAKQPSTPPVLTSPLFLIISFSRSLALSLSRSLALSLSQWDSSFRCFCVWHC
eukprot:2485321-Rhodomonas_salina.1